MQHREHADRQQPQRRTQRRPESDGPSLLTLQRQAGNRATTMLVQRATAKQTADAKAQADKDLETGNVAPYFAGNFLANHIQEAEAEVKQAKQGRGVMSSKEARNQAWKKLQVRADVQGGGSGWGPTQRQTGTNTLILDLGGVQKRALMRAVNTEQIDQLATRPPVRWFEFDTEETVPAVTLSSDGRKSEDKGKAHLGAQYDSAVDRFRIDHLSGVH